MSNKVYCIKCNSATVVLDKPVKFCSNCGYIFGSATTPTSQVKTTKPSIIIEQEDDEPIENVPQINQLEFEIIGSKLSGEELLQRRGHTSYKDIQNSPFRDRTTIGNIGKSLPPVERQIPKQKGRPKKISKEEFVKEYYSEVIKTNRDNSEIGE